jgi:hypothetical protein
MPRARSPGRAARLYDCAGPAAPPARASACARARGARRCGSRTAWSRRRWRPRSVWRWAAPRGRRPAGAAAWRCMRRAMGDGQQARPRRMLPVRARPEPPPELSRAAVVSRRAPARCEGGRPAVRSGRAAHAAGSVGAAGMPAAPLPVCACCPGSAKTMAHGGWGEARWGACGGVRRGSWPDGVRSAVGLSRARLGGARQQARAFDAGGCYIEQCLTHVAALLRAGSRSALGHALAERSGACGMRPIGVVAYREARIPACRGAGACAPPCVPGCRSLRASLRGVLQRLCK